MSWTNSTAWGFTSGPAEDWRAEASCRPGSDVDPELFHPIGRGPLAQQQIRAAKKVCSHCPVIDECYRTSQALGMEFGIWGGLTETERRKGRQPDQVFRLAWLNTRKTHCPQLHRYDQLNTYVDSRGRRHCRTCARERVSARRHREVARR